MPINNPDILEKQRVKKPVEIEIYSWIIVLIKLFTPFFTWYILYDDAILEKGSQNLSQEFHLKESRIW